MQAFVAALGGGPMSLYTTEGDKARDPVAPLMLLAGTEDEPVDDLDEVLDEVSGGVECCSAVNSRLLVCVCVCVCMYILTGPHLFPSGHY